MPKKNKLTHNFRPLIVVLLTLIIGGCTWVKKTPQGDSVRVAPADRVADCVSLGSVKTTTVDNVSIVNRSVAKVAKELETIALNEAGEAGADTIVATTAVVDGHQTFAMYKCL